MTNQSICISINDVNETMKTIGGLLDVLVGFRERESARVREWGVQASGGSLADELAAVVSEAGILIRLINSIIDGTEEQVPISELQSRFKGLQCNANMLLTRWKSKQANGMER